MTTVLGQSAKFPAREKGKDSREKILSAALSVFARDGFTAASIRTIADEAGVNIASIKYYFGGKEALYHAAATDLVDQVAERLNGPISVMLTALEDPEATKAELFEALMGIFKKSAEVHFLSEDAEHWSKFLMREQINASSAFTIVYEGVISKFVHMGSQCIARLMGTDPDSPETRLAIIAIHGQLMIFETTQNVVLKTMGWREFDREKVDKICEIVRRHTANIIGYPDLA